MQPRRSAVVVLILLVLAGLLLILQSERVRLTDAPAASDTGNSRRDRGASGGGTSPIGRCEPAARPAGTKSMGPKDLVIRLATPAALVDGRFPAGDPALDAVNALVASGSASLRRSIGLPAELLDAMRVRGEECSGRKLADLNAFYTLAIAAGADADAVVRMEAMLAGAGIEVSAHPGYVVAGDILPPATPDLSWTAGNGYRNVRDAAPAGIDAAWAAANGYRGQGSVIADVEHAWNLSHEDFLLRAGQSPPVAMLPPSLWWNAPTSAVGSHGTASLGVVAADDDDPGVRGISPASRVHVMPIEIAAGTVRDPNFDARTAVVLATLFMNPGDILLLEMQNADFYAFETDPLERACVEQATALGLHVIEAAGNGENGTLRGNLEALTHPFTGARVFDPLLSDSLAVMVGAVRSVDTVSNYNTVHQAMPFSNWGRRVDACAWGENVTTLGYGPNTPRNAFPAGNADPNQWYTDGYSGTSSASAVVAGAAGVLAQMFRERFGQNPTPAQLRNLLRMGTPSQPVYGEVGRMPDLHYQNDLLRRAGVLEHVFPGNRESAEQGRSVAGFGDLDGDGWNDVAVGDPGWSSGALLSAGRVLVHSGRTGAVLRTFTGSASGERLGHAIATAGDLDGDGSPDLLAGLPDADSNSFTDNGQMRVYSGRDGLLLFQQDGSADYEQFGWSVAAARIPVPSVVVGVPGADNGDGRVRVYFFALTTAPQTPMLEWRGSDYGPAGRFGHAVASMPDLTADPAEEILVGAPHLNFTAGAVRQGAAFVFSGDFWTSTPGRLLSRINGECGAVNRSALFGWSVAHAGDLDRDGKPDVAVGSPGWADLPGGPIARGRAYVVSGATGNTLFTHTGVHVRDQFGFSVAGVGDVDGDGADDLAVGQPNMVMTSWGVVPGRAFVFYGPFADDGISDADKAGSSGDADATTPAPVTPAPGTIVPAPPRAWRFTELWQPDHSGQVGFAVAAAGDVNRDGRADVLVGAPGNNRAYVLASRPGPYPFLKLVGFAADNPALEVVDRDADGVAGGLSSPEFSRLRIFAGALPPSARYRVRVSTLNADPLAKSLLTRLTAPGTFDGMGYAEAKFGPLPTVSTPRMNPNDLRRLVGTRYEFQLDVTLDGSTWFDGVARTSVLLTSEFP